MDQRRRAFSGDNFRRRAGYAHGQISEVPPPPDAPRASVTCGTAGCREPAKRFSGGAACAAHFPRTVG